MFLNLIRFLARGLWNLILFLVALWASLAIYYSNLPSHTLRMVLAIAFAGISIWTLWLSHSKVAKVTFLALFSAVVAWWIFIPPSHDRPWRPEVAVMPRASIDGDNVHLTSVRDFDYSSRNDFTVRYIDRDVKLSHLKGLDFYVSYWREGWVAHTFVSFIFDDAEPVSISIETRPEVGESFDPLASLFKQFELIYVVGEERDLVGLRASHRGEHVYLYHLNASPEDAQRLFMVYLKRINELADHPEFYHLLTNSCTINIIRYANAAGRRGRFDIRHLLNGLIDSYLYHSGRVDTSLSFDDLRRRSLINSAAQAAAGAPDFSERIRAALPGSEPTFDASPSK
ncbi:MAG: DUF4105 domain-containing protein [Hyphomicrobium sp.]